MRDLARMWVGNWRHVLGSLVGRPRREHILRALSPGTVGAELGVFRGEFTASLLRVVKPSRLHLIDGWWKLYGEYYPDWGTYTEFGRLSTRRAFNEVERMVRHHDSRGAVVIHVEDDVECLSTFKDAYFDWVYLDTSHEYEHTRRELALLGAKVKPEGLILGDDWHEEPTHPHHGVCRAVREFCADGQGRIIRLDSLGQWCVSTRQRC